jgi:hypothetical protein
MNVCMYVCSSTGTSSLSTLRPHIQKKTKKHTYLGVVNFVLAQNTFQNLWCNVSRRTWQLNVKLNTTFVVALEIDVGLSLIQTNTERCVYKYECVCMYVFMYCDYVDKCIYVFMFAFLDAFE